MKLKYIHIYNLHNTYACLRTREAAQTSSSAHKLKCLPAVTYGSNSFPTNLRCS